jgi:hypothetical protein
VSDLEFERRVAAALRAPVATDARAKSAVMDRVRAASAADAPRRHDAVPFAPRNTRYSIVGLALAAGVGSITTLTALAPVAQRTHDATGPHVIGDSVVATLRDTLRLVRLMFDDSLARQVAVIGDFNGWGAERTPMRRDPATRRWSATLALRDGAHRYAFVVDGTRWVPDPTAAPVRGDDGRVYSLLHVARSPN